MYVKRYGRRYYYSNPVPSIPVASVVPVSIGIDAGSCRIETEALSFNISPSSFSLSDFEDTTVWDSLADGFDSAVSDPTILLDQYHLPSDGGLAIVNGIVEGTDCIVSDGSFNPDSSLGPAGTSAVVLTLSPNCTTKFYAKGNNWVTGAKKYQTAYRSELAGVIVALTILDVLVCHRDLISGNVTIALDGESELIQNGGDWPLSVDQPSFDYLQVIRSWIKLSPYQTDFLRYDQLDWWAKRNEDVDQAAK